jgi:hypothetical protein
MNQAYDEMGPHYGAGIADKVTVELHHNASYPTLEYSSGLVDLSTGGNIISTIPASHSGSYYITVKHRNHLETTTALPVDFSGGTISYDFTTTASQAFGDNQKDLGEGVFGFYGGDANGDGSVDALDFIDLDNDASAFASGYIITDINGDGAVDALDLIVTDNNASMFVAAILP